MILEFIESLNELFFDDNSKNSLALELIYKAKLKKWDDFS